MKGCKKSKVAGWSAEKMEEKASKHGFKDTEVMGQWRSINQEGINKSVAILAQVGIQAPGFSFRCIFHLGNPIKTRVRFLFAVYIAWPMLLVAPSSYVGNLVVLDFVRFLWWNVGMQLGRSQPRAGLV